MGLIYVIDSDRLMAECVARAAKKGQRGSGKKDVCGENDECDGIEVRIFGNGIEAMAAMSEGELPDLIFLEILLDGPDGFTLLNELASYEDTARIPVVVVTALRLRRESLAEYNVVGVLDKETMWPEEIAAYAYLLTNNEKCAIIRRWTEKSEVAGLGGAGTEVRYAR